MSNKMYWVDVRPEAPWASSPAYVRAGSGNSAKNTYMYNLTGIGDEGDLCAEDIQAISMPECPVNYSTLLSNLPESQRASP